MIIAVTTIVSEEFARPPSEPFLGVLVYSAHIRTFPSARKLQLFSRPRHTRRGSSLSSMLLLGLTKGEEIYKSSKNLRFQNESVQFVSAESGLLPFQGLSVLPVRT